MQHFLYSEPGYQHTNEDAASVGPHPAASFILLCALADGQGGQSGGVAASQIAVQESLAAAASISLHEIQEPTAWYEVVSAADEAADEDREAGFCTLVCLCITETHLCGASCGDSGALLLDGGREVWLTENQCKNPPVGSSAARPVAFSAELGPSWKLLVVSDGIWNSLGWDGVAQIAKQTQGEELIAALRRAVLSTNGGKLPDDFAVVVVQSENISR